MSGHVETTYEHVWSLIADIKPKTPEELTAAAMLEAIVASAEASAHRVTPIPPQGIQAATAYLLSIEPKTPEEAALVSMLLGMVEADEEERQEHLAADDWFQRDELFADNPKGRRLLGIPEPRAKGKGKAKP